MKEVSFTTLYSKEEVAKRVEELGKQISSDFNGQQLVVVGVLKGAFVFLADLVRAIKLPLQIEFIGISSYEGTTSTGEVRITSDLYKEIKGKNILLVEDIVDTGRTIDFLIDTLKVREPKSIKICSLLSKPEVHAMKNGLDYIGFEIFDEFVIGYGLDLDGSYRELPYLAKVTQHK
ncbi:MAG: hypoxanthine phosphoribosyltransferase [Bdellovibrionota bacterium]